MRILAATDFSPASEHAVRRAAWLARDLGADLALAHVIPAELFQMIDTYWHEVTAPPRAENGQAFLENDLRAHAHPTRMDVIRLAAADLAAKLNSLCPACGMPGFQVVERLSSLLCADCGAPTREIRADIHGCLKCAHRETRARVGVEHADPGRCDYCNP